MKEIDARVQQKKDSDAAWTSSDPVLLKDELIFVDIDGEIRTKIGDGVSKYSQLEFIDKPLREMIDTHAKIYATPAKPDGITPQDIWMKIV